MSTNESGATWLSLLDEKKEDINKDFGQKYWVPGDIGNGQFFRSAFEKLCSKKAEHKFSPLEAKLLPSLIPSTEVAKAIGQSITELQNLAPNTKPEALAAVLWMLRLRTLYMRCKACRWVSAALSFLLSRSVVG